MIKSKHSVNSSTFLFAITLVLTTFLLSGVVFLGTTITSSSSSSTSQINNILGHAPSNPNMAFAQSSVATFANSASSSNDSLVFNNYENSEMGISIKYPSNFLIDESNSNETVKQVSFFPAYDDSSDYPQTYISWFNVYVEELYPPISDSSNPINISSYLEDQANLIQEQDADVTIVETSTDSMLSGFPAYELVTRSYSGNTSIDDIEIGTIVGNKLYLLNYEVNTDEVQDSLPIANKMIYSFKINPMNNLADSITKLANSSSIAEIKEKVPFLESLFSSLNVKNLTNNPYSLLSALGLNDTTMSSLESLIANSTLPSSTGSFPSSNLSSLMGSGFGSINSETLCGIQILSSLCRGDIFANHSLPLFLNNGSSLSGDGSALSQLFNLSNSSSGLLGGGSLAGAGSAVGEGINLSELRNLLGPFAMLSSPSSSSNASSSSFPFLDNGSNSFFGQSGLESSLFSSSPTGNNSDTMLFDHLFSNGGFNNNNNSSQSEMGNDSSFNPFAAIFGTNSTGFGQLMEKNSSLDSNGTNQINNNNNSATLDLMKILEFLQNKQQ